MSGRLRNLIAWSAWSWWLQLGVTWILTWPIYFRRAFLRWWRWVMELVRWTWRLIFQPSLQCISIMEFPFQQLQLWLRPRRQPRWRWLRVCSCTIRIGFCFRPNFQPCIYRVFIGRWRSFPWGLGRWSCWRSRRLSGIPFRWNVSCRHLLILRLHRYQLRLHLGRFLWRHLLR